ncbi:MAG TPA: mycofactocin system FadH/OYE family oxidoreductase 1 [Ilumatobacteraceae bacterium]|nr:mycofactocin system FadH/OYE family oxidoreductase 1 [Ilumatobacteraceae bacterium]
MQLLSPITFGSRTAANRVMFGPHVTNLGADDRSIPARQVAYYERRARGGCGTIVVEGASVHPSDWPYERSPLAERCGPGWAAIVTACRPHGALVIASLDHAGGQGSSAYSQAPLWAPSRMPEVNSREVPKWMEADDIAAVIDGFGSSSKLAVEADVDGVEINAGQHSLVRQFLSGLTNQRDDTWGQDRLLFVRQVIEAVRSAAGDRIVGLRLSCDELAPWAGITPEMAPGIAATLVSVGLDYLVVTRGSIYTVEKTRPDFHEPTGFNVELCRSVRARVHESSPQVPVILQGSIVEVGQAEWALGGYDDAALCDAVEMTRAQIADPDLVAKIADDQVDRIRPCTRCNQTCQVRDARNPIVTCIGEPTSGRETEDPDWYVPAAHPRDVVVVGAGPAGLEAARVASLRGHRVRIVERDDRVGGLALIAGPNAALVDWWQREHSRLGTDIATGIDSWEADGGTVVIQATGSLPGHHPYETADGAGVIDVADLRRGAATLPDTGVIVLFDPIGGPIAVALAEELGQRAILITQDNIAGNELARTGDLAPANTRLAQQGAAIERRTLLRTVRPAEGGLEVELEDRYTGQRRTIPCAAVVDCGFRIPAEPLDGTVQIGDAVAPRTILEAVLEGRRAALAL